MRLPNLPAIRLLGNPSINQTNSCIQRKLFERRGLFGFTLAAPSPLSSAVMAAILNRIQTIS